MFRSIVVPLDGSLLAARALPYVPLLAAPGATVTLVSVVEPQHAHTPFGHAHRAEETERLRDLLRRDLEARARPLRDAGYAVATAMPTGDAAAEILALARDADLIAMATHGRAGLAGLAAESVTYRVLHGATCPTLLYHPPPGEEAAAAIRTVVVPLDGTAFAAGALPEAADLARRHAATVVVVEVVGDEYPPYGPFEEAEILDANVWADIAEDDRKTARRDMEATVRRLRADGVFAVGLVREGTPAEAVAAVADGQPAPLVVRVTRGRTGLTRWMLGSVVEELTTRAHWPLLVLHAPTTEAELKAAHATTAGSPAAS